MVVIYLPSVHGLGDQLNGLTTAVWLSEQLGRPLRTCLDHSWITIPRLSNVDCANLTVAMNSKPPSLFLSEVEGSPGTVLVGCDICEKIRPPLVYISAAVNRRYFGNSSFVNDLKHADRVVLRYNRNVASYTSRLENRRILQSVIVRPTPIYDMCVHYRSIRTNQRLDEVVWCSSTDPVTVFSDVGSAHLILKDRKPNKHLSRIRIYANDSKSFLDMMRCKRFFVPESSFSIAAALASNASYDDVLVYNRRNCTRSTPILKMHNMFFPR